MTDKIASSTTTYYFKLRPVYSIDSGNKIVITFPSQYTGISQSPGCKLDETTVLTCSYTFPNLTVTSLAFEAEISFDIEVSSIKNPAFAQVVDTFYVYDYKSSILKQSHYYSGVEIDPKTMTSASIVPNSYKVAENTTWVISFTIAQALSSGNIIELFTPVWNNGMGAKYTRYYCSGILVCTGITGNI